MSSTGSSHRQILKSTSIIGGSTAISVVIGILRTKILAVLLGPSGIALFGLYGVIIGLVSTLAGMGIGSSGVRQIAEANGSQDQRKISLTIFTLRCNALFLGALGALVLVLFCVPLSVSTFGTRAQAGALALLSLSIFFASVSDAQTALIQGLRRIRDLAKIRIATALLGTAVTIPVVWFLRERGVAPAIVAATAVSLLISWHFARQVKPTEAAFSRGEVFRETRVLLGLGLTFMTSGLMASAANYFIRTSIVRQIGLEGTGHYQAAFALSTVYVGFILGAMGADFYPRLTAAAHDNPTCNRLVNEQSEVALLLAGPGILLTLALAPVAIRLFYSASFLPAVDILRWQILGLFGRIVTWPLGFLVVAKGRGQLFFWTELAANVAHVMFVYFATKFFGLPGTGMAFFFLYVFYALLMVPVVKGLSGFAWTGKYKMHLVLFSLLIALIFSLSFILSPVLFAGVGCAVAACSGIFSLRTILKLTGIRPSLNMLLKCKIRLHK